MVIDLEDCRDLGHEWDGEGEPDCWVVVDLETDQMIAGPYGDEETAEEAAERMWDEGTYDVVPLIL